VLVFELCLEGCAAAAATTCVKFKIKICFIAESDAKT